MHVVKNLPKFYPLFLTAQVLKIRFESISFIAKTATSFTSTVAGLVIPDLTDKIGDIKNGFAAKETLSCMAEATSLKFVSEVNIFPLIRMSESRLSFGTTLKR